MRPLIKCFCLVKSCPVIVFGALSMFASQLNVIYIFIVTQNSLEASSVSKLLSIKFENYE
jgi:hypothetical protein